MNSLIIDIATLPVIRCLTVRSHLIEAFSSVVTQCCQRLVSLLNVKQSKRLARVCVCLSLHKHSVLVFERVLLIFSRDRCSRDRRIGGENILSINSSSIFAFLTLCGPDSCGRAASCAVSYRVRVCVRVCLCVEVKTRLRHAAISQTPATQAPGARPKRSEVSERTVNIPRPPRTRNITIR